MHVCQTCQPVRLLLLEELSKLLKGPDARLQNAPANPSVESHAAGMTLLDQMYFIFSTYPLNLPVYDFNIATMHVDSAPANALAAAGL